MIVKVYICLQDCICMNQLKTLLDTETFHAFPVYSKANVYNYVKIRVIGLLCRFIGFLERSLDSIPMCLRIITIVFRTSLNHDPTCILLGKNALRRVIRNQCYISIKLQKTYNVLNCPLEHQRCQSNFTEFFYSALIEQYQSVPCV